MTTAAPGTGLLAPPGLPALIAYTAPSPHRPLAHCASPSQGLRRFSDAGPPLQKFGPRATTRLLLISTGVAGSVGRFAFAHISMWIAAPLPQRMLKPSIVVLVIDVFTPPFLKKIASCAAPTMDRLSMWVSSIAEKAMSTERGTSVTRLPSITKEERTMPRFPQL